MHIGVNTTINSLNKDHIDEIGTEFIVTHALANSAPTETSVNSGQIIDNQTNITESTV